jgi:putative glycosyltransferase (exosortase G-associated)
MIFWLAWIIIPFFWEIVPAFGGFVILIKKRLQNRRYLAPIKYPEITIIVPVFNSQDTLSQCLESIYQSTYPKDQMTVYIVDNGSQDRSYEIFVECQQRFHDMSIWWMQSSQGKSKALNLALFNSNGKYIIHVDSDGVIEKTALDKMVHRFEADMNIHAMTGTVLIQPELVEKTEKPFLKLIRRCELFEYFYDFLAGRNYESERKTMYTLSGAFSAFRKSSILKTFLYSSSTVAEDTHISFQLKEFQDHDIVLCENAFFFVDPIEDFDKLYTQRQRWQRGEIEVSHMFLIDKMKPLRFFNNYMVRLLMYDHTFAFPRAIWYFAIFYLIFQNYPLQLVFGSITLLYSLYVMIAFLFYFAIRGYLKEFPELSRYFAKQWYLAFLFPIYNLITFFIRFAGIINSIKTDMSWKTKTLRQEANDFKKIIDQDFKFLKQMIIKVKGKINRE